MMVLLKILDSYPLYPYDYSDINFRDVFLVMSAFVFFFYGVHRFILKFMPRNKGAIFQNSPVSADVLLQEESYEVATNEKFTFPVRVIIVILLIAFLVSIASFWYLNRVY